MAGTPGPVATWRDVGRRCCPGRLRRRCCPGRNPAADPGHEQQRQGRQQAEDGAPAEHAGQRRSGRDAGAQRHRDASQDDRDGAAALGGRDHPGRVPGQHRPQRAAHDARQQPGREGQRVPGRDRRDGVEQREAGQHALQHGPAGQPPQGRGDRDRGQRRGDGEGPDQQPGARLGHVQAAAHLRQETGREQVGRHIGEGRRGQGQQAHPGKRGRKRSVVRKHGVAGKHSVVGKHGAMLQPSH
jgi:hypothetical protein